MQCSCCRVESQNLREYAFSVEVSANRKTIESFHLCALCRMLYAVKPARVIEKCRSASTAVIGAARARAPQAAAAGN
jgi:hypothetical protein